MKETTKNNSVILALVVWLMMIPKYGNINSWIPKLVPNPIKVLATLSIIESVLLWVFIRLAFLLSILRWSSTLLPFHLFLLHALLG